MLKLSVAIATAALVTLACPIQANAEPFESILPSEGIDTSKYALEASRSRHIYDTFVKPTYSTHFPLRETPVLRVFLGQPGSGRSRLTQMVNRGTPLSDDSITVDTNELRRFHPLQPGYSVESPRMVHEYQMHDALKWQEMLLIDLVRYRNHVVLYSTPTDAESLGPILATYRQAGYRVEVHVPALHASISELNIIENFERTKHSDDPSRLVSRDVHAQAYRAIPLILSAAERDHLVNEITIRRRDGQIIYGNQFEDGEWRFPPNAAAALEYDRDRLLTHEERTSRLDRLEAIRGPMNTATHAATGMYDDESDQTSGRDTRDVAISIAAAMASPFTALVREGVIRTGSQRSSDFISPRTAAPIDPFTTTLRDGIARTESRPAREFLRPWTQTGSASSPMPARHQAWGSEVPHGSLPVPGIGRQVCTTTLPRAAAALPLHNPAPGGLRSLLQRAGSMLSKFPK